jgi:fluoride exporter
MIRVLAWIGVGVFGAAGAYTRFRVGVVVTSRRPGPFPWGTFIVNLTGGFVLGFLTGLSVTGDALLVFGTGFLGGYTTFSTWMVEAQRLGEDADWTRMWLYMACAMLAGLGTSGLGWVIGSALS